MTFPFAPHAPGPRAAPWISACSAALVLWASVAVAAPPEVKHCFPLGVQQRQSVEITATGTFAHWPPQAWVDRPGLTVTPVDDAKQKGKLTVTAAADAAGVFWVRLYDTDGCSAPFPLVVDSLPELIETEPNDEAAQAQDVSPPRAVVNGRLEKSDDVDTFRVTLRQGERLAVRVDAHTTFSSPMDAIVQVARPDGIVLAQNDDYRGLDPGLDFVAPADGAYLVRLFAFSSTPSSTIRYSGGADYGYRLTLTTGPLIEFALPLALADDAAPVSLGGVNLADQVVTRLTAVGDEGWIASSAEAAGWAAIDRIGPHIAPQRVPPDKTAAEPISASTTITGRLAEAGAADTFLLAGRKGQRWGLRVLSRGLGFPVDAVLTVRDSAGKQLVEVDDAGGSRDAEIQFGVPADGPYQVVVRDLHRRGGERFVYRLDLVDGGLLSTATVAASSFVAARGKPLEIPITIVRPSGSADELTFRVEGLPAGAKAEPVVSKASGDSAKAVKLVIAFDQASAEAFQGPLRIVANTEAGDRPLAVTAAVGDSGNRTAQLWLTLPAAAAP